MKMTVKQAKAELKSLGLTIKKMECGDYRVAVAYDNNAEVCAYYTNDLRDAVATARIMAKHNETIPFFTRKTA